MTFRVPRDPKGFAACPEQSAHEAAVGGRVLATIRGSLGTVVLAGRSGLLVCSCSVHAEATPPIAAVWTYDRVTRLVVQRTGALEILGLTIRGRAGALPLIALDPDGVAAALVGIDRVQHLIDSVPGARQATLGNSRESRRLRLTIAAAER